MINREYHRTPEPPDYGEIVCYVITAILALATAAMLWYGLVR